MTRVNYQRTAPAFPQSCDTAVVLGDLAGGRVILAKNSDRPSYEAQRLIGVPAATYDTDATVRCQYLTIAQARRSAALIGSQPHWLWGFEHGLNEHGVAIGNEAIHTRETPREVGLLGMDLVRLGLERGTTAYGALEAIVALLEHHGQGGSADQHTTRYYDNSFLIADPREAWVLETCGRRWAARHLTHGGYAISNRPTIGRDYDLASPDLVTYAEARGWWPRGRRPFSFAGAYTDPDNPGLPSASCRLQRSRSHVGGANGTHTMEGMMGLLRDHGAPSDGHAVWLAWPSGEEPATVCMHGRDGESSTAASMVAQLGADAQPTYWASMGPPCTAAFVPSWVDSGPPLVLAEADGTPHPSSPWWRFRRLWEAVSAAPDPAATVQRVRQIFDPFEAGLLRHVATLSAASPVGTRRALSVGACIEVLARLATLETEFAQRPAAISG